MLRQFFITYCRSLGLILFGLLAPCLLLCTPISATGSTDIQDSLTSSQPAESAEAAESAIENEWLATEQDDFGVLIIPLLPAVPHEIRAVWENLAPGLDLANLEFLAEAKIVVTVLRIDPTRYEFSLYSSMWDEGYPRPLSEWADAYDLLAAINACMFMPNGGSTAYIRRGALQNRSTVADKYSGFFVFGPTEPDLPQAAILDKTVDDWQNLLPRYDVVIQNMRLLGNDGEQLWPENGPLHAVAAIGQDLTGNILFMHCRAAINVHKLVSALLASPSLSLSRAIYVEGGSQASLTLRLPGQVSTWTGRHPADLFFRGSGIKYPLPHIVGIRPRQAAFDAD